MSETPSSKSVVSLNKSDWALKNLFWLALITLVAFLVLGFHPGLEDDSFYLAAIKKNLNPALFAHDAEYFSVHFQATIFDKLIAWSVRLTQAPLAWICLVWQFAAIFFLLHGCWRIARRCFMKPEAHWAATALVAALLGMPIGGIAINLADQYLHPRTLATALIVAAIVAVMDRRFWLAGVFLLVAFSIHAIMASFGISFCLFLYWRERRHRFSDFSSAALFLIPFGWLFDPATDAWRQAASTRGFYFLGHWHWYEWLGIFAPLVLLLLLQRFLTLRPADIDALKPFAEAVLYYGIFQTIVGFVIMLPPSLERLRPFEPMRYLHLLYLSFFLIVGGLLGTYLLDRRPYRWALLFIPLAAGMLYAQYVLYPASPHLELPFVRSENGWLQAFAWIRQNTPDDAFFATDPHYETLRGEDQHGFRALAERSVLSDYEKDAGMVGRVPSLAPRWLREVTALEGWRNFQDEDFVRLKRTLGVTWIVLSHDDHQYSVSESNVMTCLYENEQVKVCRLY